MDIQSNYIIYTDGAYSPNTQVGGIGFIIYKDDKKVCEFSKPYSKTTNQRMEIKACIIALSSIKNPSNITIYTDSMYVVGTMTLKWQRKCNQDLWYKLDKLVNKHNVEFIHVKGHNGDSRNERADKLATDAISRASTI